MRETLGITKQILNKMNNLTINIGLNVNNNEPREQKAFTLKVLNRLFDWEQYKFKVVEGGQWDGKHERVLIVSVNVGDLKHHAVKMLLSNLCIDLEQDAVSFKLNNEGSIVFDPLYTGKTFNFSEEKFINF